MIFFVKKKIFLWILEEVLKNLKKTIGGRVLL